MFISKVYFTECIYIFATLSACVITHTHLVLSVHRDTGKNLRSFTWRPTYLSPHRKKKKEMRESSRGIGWVCRTCAKTLKKFFIVRL